MQIICTKCFEKKDTTEFYGVQRDCKECTKKRVREREKKLRQNPEWVEKERKRSRDKYHRLEYKGKHKPTTKQKKAVMKRYKEKYPEKQLAKQSSGSLKPEIKGNHLHHWSYNKEHWKDVIEIGEKEHNIAHRHIIYDQERMMYRTRDGVLLDTKDSHIDYILKYINEELEMEYFEKDHQIKNQQ